MMAIMSTAIAIYFGEWIKVVIPLNLIALLLLVQVVYIGIRCYVKDRQEERGYFQSKTGVVYQNIKSISVFHKQEQNQCFALV